MYTKKQRTANNAVMPLSMHQITVQNKYTNTHEKLYFITHTDYVFIKII